MVEERETGADEAVITLAVSMHELRCPEQPQHPSGANKKTSGIGERGTTDFSGFWINNFESKVIKAMIWLLTSHVTELMLPTASCIYGITQIAVSALQSVRLIKKSRCSIWDIISTKLYL